jgi:hypothetical protein
MPSKKSEILKHKQFKGYSMELIFEYFRELQKKNVDVVVPEILAKRLKLPFGDVIVLLGLMEKDKIVKRAYQLFTYGELYPLGEYKSTRSIPNPVTHPDTGDCLDADEYFIDLVFHITQEQ